MVLVSGSTYNEDISWSLIWISQPQMLSTYSNECKVFWWSDDREALVLRCLSTIIVQKLTYAFFTSLTLLTCEISNRYYPTLACSPPAY